MVNSMQKIRQKVEWGITGIVALCTLYLAVASFLEPWMAGGISKAGTLLFLACYLAVFAGVIRLAKHVSERRGNVLLFFCILFAFFLQLLIGCNMKLVPVVDLSHVYEQCMTMLENDSLILSNQKYYGFYPNNIPITIVVYWVFRLGKAFGCIDYRMTGGIFNVLLLLLTYLAANYILKCYVSRQTRLVLMFFILTNPIYYAYASYYYTDTVSLAFMMMAAALFVAGGRQKKKWQEILLYLLAGMFLMFSVKIRITCIFLLCAYVVYQLIRGQWKALLQQLLPVLVGMVLFLSAWSGIYHMHVNYDTTETAAPATHFFMMGSNAETAGRYNGDDVRFTRKFKTHEKKVEKTTKRWIKRVKKNGVVGNVLLVLKKELRVWGIGTRSYTRYTEHVEEENIYYQIFNGKYGGITRGYMQAYAILLLVFMTAGLFLQLCSPGRNKELLLLVIYFGGGLLFYIFWESHARHSVSFLIFLTFLMIPAVQRMLGEEKSEDGIPYTGAIENGSDSGE